MTIDYNEIRKQYQELKKKQQREKLVNKDNDEREYEKRVTHQCKSVWNGRYK